MRRDDVLSAGPAGSQPIPDHPRIPIRDAHLAVVAEWRSPAAGTAAVLVIGNEILSGRTQDANVPVIIATLAELGIAVREVRIVPDEVDEIAAAVDALRRRYAFLFTTGGIGPTHDDVTADAVAVAFGVGIGVDGRALAILRARVRPEALTEARLRLARIPLGSDLIVSPVAKAPGFRIGNVFVMAGVPQILAAMLAAARAMLAAEGWPPSGSGS